jgi:hypothetical protein
MRLDVLGESQSDALSALSPLARDGFYLAGGTALCVRLEHRLSVDINLFRTEPFDAEEMVQSLRSAGVAMEHVRTSPATVHGEVVGVRTSLLSFPYPLLEPPEPVPASVPVAGLRDLAAMKIEAIASRGARKDFYDLFFICESGLGLPTAFEAYRTRFASAAPDVYHRLRALTFFDDAEREPEPMLLRVAAWADVRTFFQEQVRNMWDQGAPR